MAKKQDKEIKKDEESEVEEKEEGLMEEGELDEGILDAFDPDDGDSYDDTDEY